jgi:hypothetical protein
MKNLVRDVSDAPPSRIIVSFALILTLMTAAPALMNQIFRDNLFRSGIAQSVWLWVGATLFLIFASIDLSRVPLTLTTEHWRQQAVYFAHRLRSCLLKVAPVSTAFVFMVWASCDFTMLWPSPIPMSDSLFIICAIIFQRQRILSQGQMKAMEQARQVGEPVVILAAYAMFLGLFKHQINLDREDAVVLLGSAYLISMACRKQSD